MEQVLPETPSRQNEYKGEALETQQIHFQKIQTEVKSFLHQVIMHTNLQGAQATYQDLEQACTKGTSLNLTQIPCKISCSCISQLTSLSSVTTLQRPPTGQAALQMMRLLLECVPLLRCSGWSF